MFFFECKIQIFVLFLKTRTSFCTWKLNAFFSLLLSLCFSLVALNIFILISRFCVCCLQCVVNYLFRTYIHIYGCNCWFYVYWRSLFEYICRYTRVYVYIYIYVYIYMSQKIVIGMFYECLLNSSSFLLLVQFVYFSSSSSALAFLVVVAVVGFIIIFFVALRLENNE